MIADLHCHYPMHLLAEEPRDLALDRMTDTGDRSRLRNKLRALLVRFFARRINFRSYTDPHRWRVSLQGLEQAEARIVLSVLYDPSAEIDLSKSPHAGPDDAYYGELLKLIDGVEAELLEKDPGGERHRIVRSAGDLDAAIERNQVAFLHAVEGGFHLGATEAAIDARIEELAGRGVAYITLAHLFWRQVATNAPAIPFLPERIYNRLFPQPSGAALGQLGEAAVRAMYRHRVLIDLSHMRQDALEETFAILDSLDRDSGANPEDFPVIASHAGFRFGKQEYMLTEDTIRRIAARDGIIGLILAHHQLDDAAPVSGAPGLDRTMQTIAAHVKEIERITGDHRHTGIGSDLDGFIKPTVTGIEYAEDLGKLAPRLEKDFPGDAEAILHGNAERVLRRVLASR